MSVTKKMKNDCIVALVDDCADALEIMSMILAHNGYTNVVTAHSALDALTRLGSLQRPVDVIITDYYLGDGTGTDVVAGLMMANKAPPLRVLVTGNPSANMAGGRIFDHTLLKPIRAQDLCGILDTHFSILNRVAS
jgi:CheY-like chemotaxis protein